MDKVMTMIIVMFIQVDEPPTPYNHGGDGEDEDHMGEPSERKNDQDALDPAKLAER